jgi:hypothetical protein
MFVDPAHHTTLILAAYVGPDVLMPFASAVAAVVGFLLMFWKRTVAFFKAAFDRIARLFGKKTDPKATDTPQ